MKSWFNKRVSKLGLRVSISPVVRGDDPAGDLDQAFDEAWEEAGHNFRTRGVYVIGGLVLLTIAACVGGGVYLHNHPEIINQIKNLIPEPGLNQQNYLPNPDFAYRTVAQNASTLAEKVQTYLL